MERKMTQEDVQASQNLKKVWKVKKEVLSLTQEKVAAIAGWSTQATFGHFLHGRTVINVENTLKLSYILQCDPQEIREDLPDWALQASGIKTDKPLDVKELVAIYEQLPKNRRKPLLNIFKSIAAEFLQADTDLQKDTITH